MPIYCYRCECGQVTNVFKYKYEPDIEYKCSRAECGKMAKRSFSDEQITTDLIENVRWSESMGVNVEQIPEAMRIFPGSEYHPETGALKITSRKDKLKKMKERGYVEFD